MRVYLAFEFEDVNPGSPEDEQIVDAITQECERMRIAFDARGCWIDDVTFPEEIKQ